MVLASHVARQLDLFSTPRIEFDAAFASIRRTPLADDAWIEYAPGWVSGHDALFDQLAQALAWRKETRRMYDREVTTPRLLASIPREQAVIEAMRQALSARYGEDFVRTTAALYRDGNDSVAWHGDTTARDLPQATVATVSLGEPRKLLLRPTSGGASGAYQLGRGDLFVMGGTCQRTWRHAVPKAVYAAPRMAVMFRPAWDAP